MWVAIEETGHSYSSCLHTVVGTMMLGVKQMFLGVKQMFLGVKQMFLSVK